MYLRRCYGTRFYLCCDWFMRHVTVISVGFYFFIGGEVLDEYTWVQSTIYSTWNNCVLHKCNRNSRFNVFLFFDFECFGASRMGMYVWQRGLRAQPTYVFTQGKTQLNCVLSIQTRYILQYNPLDAKRLFPNINWIMTMYGEAVVVRSNSYVYAVCTVCWLDWPSENSRNHAMGIFFPNLCEHSFRLQLHTEPGVSPITYRKHSVSGLNRIPLRCAGSPEPYLRPWITRNGVC